MRIRIDEISERGLLLRLLEDPESFPVLAEIARGGTCQFIGPVEIQVHAVRIHDVFEVEGKLSALVRLSCSRCLKEFETALQSPIQLTYTRELPKRLSGSNSGEIELTAQQIGLILFHGEEIDLVEGVQEHLVMSIPFHPLCAETCKGLCPRCGADLNTTACQCDRLSVHESFAVLKNFKVLKK